MKVWIGHYYENSNEWFIVWAKDKQDAWDKVDELGSPDGNSTREFGTPGIVNFLIQYDDEGKLSYLPSKVEGRKENWLLLGTVGAAEDPNEYITRLMTDKDSTQKFAMKVWIGDYLPKQKKPIKQQESFIVWAKTKQEALQHVETIVGKADPDSLFELKKPGFINFHAARKKGNLVCTPPKDDVDAGAWVNIAGVC